MMGEEGHEGIGRIMKIEQLIKASRCQERDNDSAGDETYDTPTTHMRSSYMAMVAIA